MKRTPLKRKPKGKSARRTDPVAWATVTRTGCLMCREFPVPAALRVGRRADLQRRQWHHVVGQRHLKREGLHELLDDPVNGICLCAYHHARHENAVQRVPLCVLPPTAVAWAEERGFGWALDKEYA